MKIECQVNVNEKVVKITLEGEFNAITEVLRELGFELEKAEKLGLK